MHVRAGVFPGRNLLHGKKNTTTTTTTSSSSLFLGGRSSSSGKARGTRTRRRRRTRRCVQVQARKQAQAQATQRTSEVVSGGSGGLGAGGGGLDVKVAGGVALFVFALVSLWQRAKRRNRGSVDRLVSRGMLEEDREGKDPYYNNMMKNVNKLSIQPLSQEQIEQARKRRAGNVGKPKGGSGSDKAKLESFDIPENHPWAEKTSVAKDDEELIKARLAVKRGLPLESLSDKESDQGNLGNNFE